MAVPTCWIPYVKCHSLYAIKSYTIPSTKTKSNPANPNRNSKMIKSLTCFDKEFTAPLQWQHVSEYTVHSGL